jgi:ribosomal protein S18 acetylase RimI-like enzyme
MKVIEVKNRKDMRSFVRLPQKLFGKDPCYIPPVWMDEKKAYGGKHNPILKNSIFCLFLALDDAGTPVGRVIAYIDHNHNSFYKVKMGFFGAFECINDPSAGRKLIEASEAWLRENDMEYVRGPIHPTAENWGFIYLGYESPPVYMSPWNPPYYHNFFTKMGYIKSKDLLVYEADIKKGYTLPDRYAGYPEKFEKNYPDIKIRRLDLKHLKADARSIWEISNLALADNWGYVPLELPVMEDMLRKLKLIVDPDAVWIVEDGKKAIGYCLGFPDINILLKQINGSLLPFGWIKFLYNLRKIRDYRLFGLAVHPNWQGKALDSLMYVNLYRHLLAKKVRMEANYILEDNLYIKNALEKLGMKHIKTYRIYDKQLSQK